jgi:amino acid transporter
MGRSEALPKKFFGVVEAKHRIPRNNILFIGAVILVGCFLMDFDLGAEMLNFGALIAFMGVNVAALVHYYVRQPNKKLLNLLLPLCGFLVCLLLFLNLSRPAQIAGTVWMLVGVAFGAWRTKWFRSELVNFDFVPETDA